MAGDAVTQGDKPADCGGHWLEARQCFSEGAADWVVLSRLTTQELRTWARPKLHWRVSAAMASTHSSLLALSITTIGLPQRKAARVRGRLAMSL